MGKIKKLWRFDRNDEVRQTWDINTLSDVLEPEDIQEALELKRDQILQVKIPGKGWLSVQYIKFHVDDIYPSLELLPGYNKMMRRGRGSRL